MASTEILELLDDPAHAGLEHRWIAVDPHGGEGVMALRSGAVVVDHDEEIDLLCRRLSDARKSSLTIFYVGERRPSRA